MGHEPTDAAPRVPLAAIGPPWKRPAAGMHRPGGAAGVKARPGMISRSSAAFGRGLLVMALAVVGVSELAPVALAQQSASVVVDDSPWSRELLRRARDASHDNAPEAVRLLQEALDDFASRLVPWSDESPDRFRSVRSAALSLLLDQPPLLERYRNAESGNAAALLEAGELERLAQTRLLTPAGLRAALRLAQRDVEAGRFTAALERLDETARHPDRQDVLPHLLMLEAMAAWGAGDDQRGAAARDLLLQVDGDTAEACAAALARFDASRPLPPPARGRTSLERMATGPMDVDASWHLIAEQPLSRSLYGRAFENESPLRSMPRNLERASLLVMLPTVVGDRVVINEGHRLRMLDRLSGRVIWDAILGTDALGRDGGAVGDMNIVTVAGDALVTLSGHAYASERSGPGRVVCVDPRTGHERWSRDLSVIRGDDEFSGGLFPYGAPLVHDDAVLVLARRVNSRLESAEYLVSLALDTGQVRWTQHLASSSGVRLGGQRAFSSPILEGGDVLVASSVGAIACIDAATGEPRWLVRGDVPIRDPRYEHEPWELGGPVVCSRGVIALLPDQSRVVCLDRATGAEIEGYTTGTTTAWGQPRYFLVFPGNAETGDPELVAAIGSDIVVFDTRHLATPLWRLSETEASFDATDARGGIRGRVQAAGRTLVVPRRGAVHLVDADSGDERGAVATSGDGNPCLVGSQLLLATVDRLESYMPFGAAEVLMRERLAENPDDPDRAFALLELGLRAGRLDLCMEATTLALRAIESAPNRPAMLRSRTELYNRLLAVNAAGLGARSDEGEALHVLIGSVASTPQQRVVHLLGYGDWLAGRDRLADAVEAWQSILSDAELASAFLDPTMSRQGLPGSTAATERLVQLAGQHGRQVYAPQDAFARLRLEQAGDAMTTDELLALGRAYPLAAAGVSATITAIHRLREAGEAERAVEAAMNALRLDAIGALASADRQRLVSEAVDAMLAIGWTDRAYALLRSMGRVGGDPDVTADGRTARASAWVAEIDREPVLGAFDGIARELPGRLLRAAPGTSPVPALDRFMTTVDGRVQLRGDDLEVRWTVPVDDDDPRLLAWLDDDVLLWLHAGTVEPICMRLDLADGASRWMSPRMASILPPPPLAAGRPADALTPAGEPFDPGEVLPSVSGNGLAVVRRNGDAAVISLEDGRTVRWMKSGLMRRVYSAVATEAGLLLTGVGAGGSATGSGENGALVMLIGMNDGEVLARYVPRTGQEVRWAHLAPGGEVVLGTDRGVEAFAAPGEVDPEPLWTVIGPDAQDLRRGWVLDDITLVADDSESILAVRTADGERLPAAFRAPSLSRLPARLRTVVHDDDGVVLLYEQRVVAFDHAGAISGMDAVSDDRDFRMIVSAGDRLVTVNALGSEQIELPEGLGRRTQFLYALYQLDRSQGCRLVGAALQISSVGQRYERASAIDGWLLMSTGSVTTAVPLPGER